MDSLRHQDPHQSKAILVSRESATCRLVETNLPATFAINANHSDMVKFTKESHYYHTALSKLSDILPPMPEFEVDTNDTSRGRDQLTLAAHGHHDTSTNQYLPSTLLSKDGSAQEPQMEQERNGSLMYLKRLEPFLVSMQQFGEMAAAVEMFSSVSRIMAYVWVSLVSGALVRVARKSTYKSSQGPMKHILHVCGADFQHLGVSSPLLTDFGV